MTDGTDGRETLADADHTHPYTDETFGGVYRRGPAVADGARPAVGADAPECLRDVEHDASEPTTNEVWKRGEGVAEDVRDGDDG